MKLPIRISVGKVCRKTYYPSKNGWFVWISPVRNLILSNIIVLCTAARWYGGTYLLEI